MVTFRKVGAGEIYKIAAFIFLVVLTLVGLDATWLVIARQDATRNAEIITQNLSRSIEQHMVGTFQSVDNILSIAVQNWNQYGTRPAERDRIRNLLIAAEQNQLSTSEFMMADADGRVLFATVDPSIWPRLNYRDREYFKYHQSHPGAGLYVGQPVQSHLNGAWILTLSKRIDDQDGRFAGLIMARIPMAYFQNYYESFDIGRDGLMSMIREDGIVMVRRPVIPAGDGRTSMMGVVHPTPLPAGLAGTEIHRSSVDGIERLRSYRRAQGYPVMLTVGLSTDEIYGPWRRTVLLHILGLTAIMALLAVVAFRLFLQIAQRSRSDAQALASDAARVQAQAAVLEATRYLVLAEEIAKVGHWRVDAAGSEIFWSAEVYRIHGRPVESGPPDLSRAIQFYHPADREKIAGLVEAALSDGANFSVELRIIREDNGSLRDVATVGRAEYGADGRITGIFGVFTDITEHRVADRERERLSRRLLMALEAGKVGIWELSGTENRFFADESSLRLFGWPGSPDGLDLAAWLGLLHPDDRASMGVALADCAAGIADLNAEYRVIWPDGTIRTIQSRGSRVAAAEGEPWRIVGTNWDITEIRLLNAALAAEKERAEQANAAKTSFLATMSHEIRTPMNGIIGMNGLLLRTELTPHQRRLVDAGRSSADALLALIDDILDISKLEAGKLSLEQVDFDLGHLVQDVAALLRLRADEKSINLTVKSVGLAQGPSPLWLRGDSTRLRQVLLNLVANAIKFTETGDVTIRVAANTATGGRVALGLQVIDTGIGISDAAKSRLFEPFEQADQSITRRFGGSGLGLSICKKLITLMGGEIGVKDRPGGGSIFWTDLVLDEAGPQVLVLDSVDRTQLRAAWRHGRILLVEDHPINREVASLVLEELGYQVESVADGFAAISAAAAGAYDAILMDMQMPGCDGLAATQAIRQSDGPNRSAPIIALTANAMPLDQEHCLKAGMNDYMSKPIDPHRLAVILSRWTNEKKWVMGLWPMRVRAEPG